MSAYYDYVLAAIPLVMLTLPSLLYFNGLGMTTAVPLGMLPVVAIIGHAMFVRAPTSQLPSATMDEDVAPQSAGQQDAA